MPRDDFKKLNAEFLKCAEEELAKKRTGAKDGEEAHRDSIDEIREEYGLTREELSKRSEEFRREIEKNGTISAEMMKSERFAPVVRCYAETSNAMCADLMVRTSLARWRGY